MDSIYIIHDARDNGLYV